MSKTIASPQAFKSRLKHYQELINADIKAYVAYLQESSDTEYGKSSSAVTKAFCTVLDGGNRLRSVLTLVGYEMSGGTNQAMILQAARAMEMFHAALLIFDDFQDQSVMRRDKPAAYIQLAKEFNDEHIGVSLSINAGLLGIAAAEMILSNLDVEPELRANAVSITNRTLVTTLHGQNADQLSHIMPISSAKIALWKTAPYTVLNPLHVGMVLAGAGCEDTDAITPYALELGQAFQIVNDIKGVFSDNNGKDPLDDIKEGKNTPLTEYALEHASPADKKVLQAALGNQNLTGADFKRCQAIFKRCGALDFAQTQAQTHVQQAVDSLLDVDQNWPATDVKFLHDLATTLI